MCCRWCGNCYFGAFALIIVAELAASLVVSIAGAFFSNPSNVWGYVILLVDIGFVSFLTHYVCKELFWNKTQDFTLNWICGMCSVVTMIIFGAVYTLTKPMPEVYWSALAVYILAVMMLWLVASCYVIFIRLGHKDAIRNSHNPPKRNKKPVVHEPKSDAEKGDDGEGKTFEQSLAQIVDHVQNTPDPNRKQYTLYAVGSETPFEVRMN